MSVPLLEARGRVKHLGGRRVVDGVDLVCRAGEVLGLLGPNGAGKTTTLRMLYGMNLPIFLLILPLAFASGTYFPIDHPVLIAVATLNPIYHLAEGLRGCCSATRSRITSGRRWRCRWSSWRCSFPWTCGCCASASSAGSDGPGPVAGRRVRAGVSWPQQRSGTPHQEDTMAIKVGDRLPEGTLMELGANGPAPVNVTEAAKGKKIVLFGIPGAFTPT